MPPFEGPDLLRELAKPVGSAWTLSKINVQCSEPAYAAFTKQFPDVDPREGLLPTVIRGTRKDSVLRREIERIIEDRDHKGAKALQQVVWANDLSKNDVYKLFWYHTLRFKPHRLIPEYNARFQ